MNCNGPCLEHCYKKLSSIGIINCIIIGIIIGKYFNSKSYNVNKKINNL